METRSLKCDQCEKELTTRTQHPAKYSIEVRSFNSNINDTGSTFAVYIKDPLPNSLHFCNLKCLAKYMDAL